LLPDRTRCHQEKEKPDIGDFFLGSRRANDASRGHEIDEKPAIGDVFFLGQRIQKDGRVMRQEELIGSHCVSYGLK
jgi:hypothetical protein